ncbi:MAG: methyltransferase domain-containing protein [Crocinitomicaceae bacterium]|nr:methyltransferase domain-containing protein [Crocinitomicaceae bacterium]
MKEFWDERYSAEEYVYGELPNDYLKEKLALLTPSTILFPAEGEGRNAVYAAMHNWTVSAFDLSSVAKIKAEQLATKKKVNIDYSIASFENTHYPKASFDAIALIYAHLPNEIRRKSHQQLVDLLAVGGTLIIEGFSKTHAENQKTNPRAGGPKEVDMLYDLDELKADFPNFEFIEAEEKAVELNEGEYHKGKANVVRLFAKKKL